MKQHLLVATAGHIDHGKTALVKALTGTDTDRLPDEKRRQITIDLGFASLKLEHLVLGIVDVPGHQRFVKNMLAGATGVDLAMLIVAADEGVKPQTREHVEILEYLRLKVGVVVVTKCDLVEPDWIELVEQEIGELTEGTFLERAATVRVSAQTGAGIAELRQVLGTAADRIAALHVQGGQANDDCAPFRMAIDRVFTLPGHGTVVTGSVASGRVCVGDELELQPQSQQVRVRMLQTHETAVDAIGCGQRAAVNLTGVRYSQIDRGQNLATPGALGKSRCVTVELRMSPHARSPLKNRSRVRFHIGTAEVQGMISLFGNPSLRPGQAATAQIFLSEDAVCVWGQPFVLRNISPVYTLGGGRVLDCDAVKLRRLNDVVEQHLSNLASDTPVHRAAAAAYFRGTRKWQREDLFGLAGVEECQVLIERLVQENTVEQLELGHGRTRLMHCEVVADLNQHIEKFLGIEHEKRPLNRFVEISRISKYFGALDGELLKALLRSLEGAGRIVMRPQGVALSAWKPKLSEGQDGLLQQIVEQYKKASFSPPSAEQLGAQFGQRPEAIASLLKVASESQSLIQINTTLYLHSEAEQDAKLLLAQNMSGGRALTVSQIKTLLNTSRKIAVPFCEYLDQSGFTTRDGALRQLARPGAAGGVGAR
ncbi:MAG: selenocysteine-specific translation elongation factor [Pirellulales bacterium]|nr:selenocysteine-specific translation elongation factor [Pirellulales bacterium]